LGEDAAPLNAEKRLCSFISGEIGPGYRRWSGFLLFLGFACGPSPEISFRGCDLSESIRLLPCFFAPPLDAPPLDPLPFFCGRPEESPLGVARPSSADAAVASSANSLFLGLGDWFPFKAPPLAPLAPFAISSLDCGVPGLLRLTLAAWARVSMTLVIRTSGDLDFAFSGETTGRTCCALRFLRSLLLPDEAHVILGWPGAPASPFSAGIVALSVVTSAVPAEPVKPEM